MLTADSAERQRIIVEVATRVGEDAAQRLPPLLRERAWHYLKVAGVVASLVALGAGGYTHLSRKHAKDREESLEERNQALKAQATAADAAQQRAAKEAEKRQAAARAQADETVEGGGGATTATTIRREWRRIEQHGSPDKARLRGQELTVQLDTLPAEVRVSPDTLPFVPIQFSPLLDHVLPRFSVPPHFHFDR